jgi:hypothetical protein
MRIVIDIDFDSDGGGREARVEALATGETGAPIDAGSAPGPDDVATTGARASESGDAVDAGPAGGNLANAPDDTASSSGDVIDAGAAPDLA